LSALGMQGMVAEVYVIAKQNEGHAVAGLIRFGRWAIDQPCSSVGKTEYY